MLRRPLTSTAATLTAAVVFCVATLAFAQSGLQVLVNNVGYERTGVKRAIVQASAAVSDTKCDVVNAQGAVVHTVNLPAYTTVGGWGGRYFKVADFTSFNTAGEGYKIKVGSVTSPAFSIGDKVLQAKTGADVVGFFKGMRSDDDRDKSLPVFGSDRKVNVYGGWWDANGDPGKHISHLSYANYFNPQQIPLVVWALLHANEVQPGAFGAAAREEAAWGADYLLRSLAPEGYFYMSVFDNWGDGYQWVTQSNQSKGAREICVWGDPAGDGIRFGDYQCAMREGGGASIAALARAYKANISGDSSAARYLAGAERAYEHLKANPTKYQDDKKENIIDDYTGLLAASELYHATGAPQYRADAQDRVTKLLARQSSEGWFFSGTDNSGQNIRPFYHAADEGLPVVALSRYYEVVGAGVSADEKRKLRSAVRKNLLWYNNITYQSGSNPFEYVKMYRAVDASGSGGVAGTDLAKGKAATASRVEGSYTADNAFDGIANSRWSSYSNENGAQNDSQWIYVELDNLYKVNRVVLNWEAAYGKHYRIEVSTGSTITNGTSWTKAFEITNNESSGSKTHSFSPVDAKFVRMFGVTRGNPNGGFSLFSFEVYGESATPTPTPSPYQVRYFVPHENETGYWWQGENARLASMAAAFTIGARLADSSGTLWRDTLSSMAAAQLDWILGRNPFEICMMEGYGAKTYPTYPAGKFEKVKGGICNGITAKRSNQDDIEWAPYASSSDSSWGDWRWIEQWLPHNAWYLIAVSSLSYRIDNPLEPDEPDVEVSVKHNASAKSTELKISAIKGMGMRITLPFNADDKTTVSVYNIQGKKVYTHKIQRGLRAVSTRLPSTTAKGTYIVHIGTGEGKKAFGKLIFR